ncbi:TetR/AcrR family transcriptional regulator, partial [Dysosmobacter welbionis]
MPKDKTETHERIIPAAMKIFLEKGFEKATMREIAEEAGITAAGLYRHFVDKEAMFAALVEPVLSELQKWCERTRQVDYDFLEQGDLDAMWDSGNDLGLVVEQIYSHFNEFKLLLCCSAGTK